jgi:hypothetical protein
MRATNIIIKDSPIVNPASNIHDVRARDTSMDITFNISISIRRGKPMYFGLLNVVMLPKSMLY